MKRTKTPETFQWVQAPMAGGTTSTDLVVAVCEAGGIGWMGSGYQTPEAIRTQAKEVASNTSGKFGINLFVPEKRNEEVEEARKSLQSLYERAELAQPNLTSFENEYFQFHGKVKAICESSATYIGFTFGIPSNEILQQCRQAGKVIVGTATNEIEAQHWLQSGCEVLVLQGKEAGGHRGSHDPNASPNYAATTNALLQMIRPLTDLHLYVAGGIMSGKDAAMFYELGADGVQIGTAFLQAMESGLHPTAKGALAKRNKKTTWTKAFSGRWARGLQNEFMEKYKNHPHAAYPLQHELTVPIRKWAKQTGNAEWDAVWAGEGYERGEVSTASMLLQKWQKEFHDRTNRAYAE
ncbi:NAD(P)H-dependent flavin oxidoreductase [Bacillus fonticola]|uniref:NAD(P)H-dependent flavin oxidoreductase n=1 Tax=Bacillus fonticola TaxID=2728853 RepID=UPI001475A1D7|nr:nitronate monooxygenase [Bacillus fonticola]